MQHGYPGAVLGLDLLKLLVGGEVVPQFKPAFGGPEVVPVTVSERIHITGLLLEGECAQVRGRSNRPLDARPGSHSHPAEARGFAVPTGRVTGFQNEPP